MPQPHIDGTETPPSELEAQKAALDAKRDELANMPESEVISNPGLEPFAAAGVVLGNLERIEKHRDAIVVQFGDAGAKALDDLPIVALATRQAHIEVAMADTASDLSGMHQEVLADHRRLLVNGDALASDGLLDAALVDRARPVQGYLTTVQSTFILIGLYRQSWAKVEGKSLVTREDLDRAERRAQAFMHKLDKREQGTTRLSAADMRARALTKLIKTYSQVRRMLTYVRWDAEDADQIAPTLFTSRRAKSRNAGDGDAPPVEPGTPAPVDGDGPFTS